MPTDEVLLQHFDSHIKEQNEIFEFLESLKDEPEMAAMAIQPVLPLLITAAEFLAENLETLKQTYIDVAG